MSVDQILVCADCNSEFPFTASEREFYESKGFSAPRRCKPCRDAAKAAKGQGGGGSSSYGGGASAGRTREMHNVTCARCNQQTQVPFKPTGDRPVYCRDCFQR